MANFNIAYERTAKFEGGYVFDPNDNGGETFAGISRKANPKWSGWKIIDACKSKSDFPSCLKTHKLLHQEVLKVYKEKYWNPIRGNEINVQEVANEIYDFAVNAGVATSIKLQQRQYRLKETGKMDDLLLRMLNKIKK